MKTIPTEKQKEDLNRDSILSSFAKPDKSFLKENTMNKHTEPREVIIPGGKKTIEVEVPERIMMFSFPVFIKYYNNFWCKLLSEKEMIHISNLSDKISIEHIIYKYTTVAPFDHFLLDKKDSYTEVTEVEFLEQYNLVSGLIDTTVKGTGHPLSNENFSQEFLEEEELSEEDAKDYQEYKDSDQWAVMGYDEYQRYKITNDD